MSDTTREELAYERAETEYKRGVRAAVGIIAVLCGGIEARCFDRAKWSRRETPADPFEEG